MSLQFVAPPPVLCPPACHSTMPMMRPRAAARPGKGEAPHPKPVDSRAGGWGRPAKGCVCERVCMPVRRNRREAQQAPGTVCPRRHRKVELVFRAHAWAERKTAQLTERGRRRLSREKARFLKRKGCQVRRAAKPQRGRGGLPP